MENMLPTSFVGACVRLMFQNAVMKLINGTICYFNRIMLKLGVWYVIVAALDRIP